MAGWRIIDLTDFAGRLTYRRGQVVIQSEAKPEARVPLEDVAVILIGLKASLNAALLHQLAQFDVAALVCGWDGRPVTGCIPWADHTRVGARQRAQVEASLPSKKNAWGRIVKAKIGGQQANLAVLERPGARALTAYRTAVRSGDPENMEAHAARVYWGELFGRDAGFTRVSGTRTGRNGLLDYGYTILRGHAVRAVLSAGLIPAVGLFHRGRANPFNLADDLIEPFRPVVDWAVANLPPSAELGDPTVKQALVACSSSSFSEAGYSAATEMTSLAQRLGRYFEGEVSRLDVPQWDPWLVRSDG